MKSVILKSMRSLISERTAPSWSGSVFHGGKPIANFKDGDAIWFSTCKNVAGTNATTAPKWYGLYSRGQDPEQVFPLERAVVTLAKPFIVNANDESYFDLPTPREMIDSGFTKLKKVDTDLVVDWAKENGYDGVIFKDVLEGKGSGDTSDTIAVFSKSSISMLNKPKNWPALCPCPHCKAQRNFQEEQQLRRMKTKSAS